VTFKGVETKKFQPGRSIGEEASFASLADKPQVQLKTSYRLQQQNDKLQPKLKKDKQIKIPHDCHLHEDTEQGQADRGL
jgi:hypothetical protein